MSYRSQPSYRSWNASALGLKTKEHEEPDKSNNLLSKDRQRPRRESWSQPSRGRSVRGRGFWGIDNRQTHRRHTMPNSKDGFQDRNYNCHTNEEPSDCKIVNQWDDNPIAEETSPECGNELKTEGNYKDNHQDEAPSWSRKYCEENIYRPPKSRSTSYIKEHWRSNRSNSSSDDGSQSHDYSSSHSSGSKMEYHKVQKSNSWERGYTDHWVHDKYEYEYDSDLKDISTSVSSLNINSESLKENNTEEITSSCKKIDKAESPRDQTKPLNINPELPKVVNVKISDLKLKDSDEKSESMKNEPEVTLETNPEVTPYVTSITSKEEEASLLINLDDDDNSGMQQIQTKISEDILTLDWMSFQKAQTDKEVELAIKQKAIKTKQNPYKLDTELKDFDSLIS